MGKGLCREHVLSGSADCYGLHDPKNPVCAVWCAMRLSCCVNNIPRKDPVATLEEALFDNVFPQKSRQ
jgi:hypothetical protein